MTGEFTSFFNSISVIWSARSVGQRLTHGATGLHLKWVIRGYIMVRCLQRCPLIKYFMLNTQWGLLDASGSHMYYVSGVCVATTEKQTADLGMNFNDNKKRRDARHKKKAKQVCE